MAEEKKRRYEMGPEGCNRHTERDLPALLKAVEAWLCEDGYGASVGEVFELKIVEMTDAEYEALPEYDGP